jgi:hypothetical protein
MHAAGRAGDGSRSVGLADKLGGFASGIFGKS